MNSKILVGTAGWSYRDWDGRVYPRRTGPDFDPLAYLASFFDLVEVNTTFYRLPEPVWGENWLRRVENNPGFQFLLKAPRTWTHERTPPTKDELHRFCRLADILKGGDALGAVLLQFPWSCRYNESNRNLIAGLAEQLERYRVAIEVRHGSWQRGEWYSHLSRLGCLPVNIDQPCIGDSLMLASETGPDASYFRLHGRNDDSWFAPDAGRDMRYNHLYTDSELRDIQTAVAEATRNTPQVFVVTNNHYLGQAVVNALQIRHHFRGERVEVPEQLLHCYPQLSHIATPDSRDQGDLFSP